MGSIFYWHTFEKKFKGSADKFFDLTPPLLHSYALKVRFFIIDEKIL